jgi:hypothetical protein
VNFACWRLKNTHFDQKSAKPGYHDYIDLARALVMHDIYPISFLAPMPVTCDFQIDRNGTVHYEIISLTRKEKEKEEKI